MPSASRHLRCAAAPTKQRLIRLLGTISTLDDPPQHASTADARRHFESQLAEQQHLLDAINSSMSLLSDKEEQWLAILQNPETGTEEEYLAFEESQQNGFLQTLEQGREQSVIVSSYIRQIEAALSRLSSASRNSVASPEEQERGSDRPSLARRNSSHEAASQQDEDTLPLQTTVLQLPRLTMQTFDGTLAKWPVFWDWYLHAVHMQQIPELQKLIYLKSCLQGPAETLIGAYALRSNNYHTVVDVLKKKYANESAITEALYDELDKLPRASEGNLRYTTEQIDRLLELLAHQGEDTNSTLIVRMVERKFPRSVLEKLQAARIAAPHWDVEAMRVQLSNLVLIQENVNRALGERLHPDARIRQRLDTTETLLPSSALPAVSLPHCGNRPQQSVSSHAPPSRAPAPLVRPTCPFCQRTGHKAHECRTVATPQDRNRKVLELKLCFRCLKAGHMASTCNAHNCFRCKRRHHPALCSGTGPQGSAPRRSGNVVTQSATAETTQEDTMALPSITAKSNGLLWCLPVLACAAPDGREISTIAFLDSGSERSYITTDLAAKLDAEGQAESLSVRGFAANEPITIASQRLQLTLYNMRRRNPVKLAVNTVPQIIGQPLQCVLSPTTRHRSCVSTAQRPGILLGADVLPRLLLPHRLRTDSSGCTIISTRLGNVLTYPSSEVSIADPLQCLASVKEVSISDPLLCLASVNDDPDEIKRFWALELLGIQSNEEEADEDLEAQQHFEATVQVEPDGRLQVAFPWRTNATTPMSDNFALAWGRLKSQWNRLQAAPQILQRYEAALNDQLQNGIVEVSTREPAAMEHYLPHQAVLREEKESTKLRVVYDGSARLRDRASLNEHILRGPVILPALIGVLFRWRLPPIVVVADIEKAFHQLSLRESDRPFTKFLWLKDVRKPPTSENLCVYRFARLLFGIICSPFLLAGALKYLLQQVDTPLAREIERDIYVDNVLFGAQDGTQALEKYRESKQYFASAKMRLRQFKSNDEHFNKTVPEEDLLPGHVIKVLSVGWNTSSDSLILQPKPLHEHGTKRTLLAALASTYDPLGLISPMMVPVKCFIQQLWKLQMGWDVLLPPQLAADWQRLVCTWDCAPFELNRRVHLTSNTTLHVFADASAFAYGAVAYILSDTGSATLVFAKARLAPVKPTTIPRLELLACVVATRVVTLTRRELHNGDFPTIVWSDSQAVLHWLASKQKQPRFVENRLKECREANVTFRYVPTKDNPADVLSRGCTAADLRRNHLWWNAPSWLLDHAKWPQWPVSTEQKDETEASDPSVNLAAMATSVEPLMDTTHFSSWPKLRRVTAIILSFVARLRRRQPVSSWNTRHFMTAAEELWWKFAQQSLPRDIAQNGQKDAAGVQRFVNRVDSDPAQLPLVLLPRQGHVTELIVREAHERILHGSATLTLAKVREQYWIPKGRRTVTSILRHCHGCQRWKAKPFQLPPFPPLPTQRVVRTRPFENVGVDYFGPIAVKVKAEKAKRWVTLFTCFSTRAIHLEIAEDCSARTCLLVFRRFFARRGYPSMIYSDNGTQLSAVQKLFKHQLEQVQQDESVRRWLTDHDIEWRFITPNAPWQGGVYERIIGLVKTALRPAIGRRLLDDAALHTVCLEAEAVVNSRPLIALNEDPASPLRPIDFLITHATVTYPLPVADGNDDPEYHPQEEKAALLEYWKSTTKTTDRFWQLWYKQYLQILRERTQQQHRGPRSQTHREPQLGEIVLVQAENLPRGVWPLAQIVHLQGQPNTIRAATVKLANGHQWTRPINHLYPLEVQPVSPDVRPQHNEDRPAAPVDAIATRTRSHAAGGWHSQVNLMSVISAFMILALCTTGTRSLNASTQCTKHRSGMILPLPRVIPCTERKTNHDQGSKARVAIYRPTVLKRWAFFCTNVTRVVCTRAFLAWEMRVTKDEVTVQGTPTEVCWKLVRQKEAWVDGKEIRVYEEAPRKWRSRVPTEYAYGWIGTRCYTVTNLLLEETEIFSHDGSHAVLDVGKPTPCLWNAGSCKGPQATAVWTVEAKTCRYEKRDEYIAHMQPGFVTVPKLQATFQIKNDTPRNMTECQIQQALEAENGFLIVTKEVMREKRSKRGSQDTAEERDKNNPKYQFLYNELRRDIERKAQLEEEHRCHLENHLRTIVRWIARTDATTAARILTEREDVSAMVANDHLLVHACDGADPITLHGKENPIENVKALVFDAPTLSRFETDQLATTLELIQANTRRMNPEIGSTDRKQNIFDRVRDSGEQAMQELRNDLGMTASELAGALDAILAHWRLTLSLTLLAVGGIGVTILCWYCRWCGVMGRIARRPKRTKRSTAPLVEDPQRDPPIEVLTEPLTTKDAPERCVKLSTREQKVTFVPLRLPAPPKRG